MADLTGGVRAAARRFLATLDGAARDDAVAPFATTDRTTWTYLPGPRPGVAVGDLTDAGRAAFHDLVGATLSTIGADRTRAVMELDDVLRDLERGRGKPGWERRHSDHYWVRVLGDPGDETFAWHVGGHHVGLHATLVGPALSLTPSFLGANPAVVPHGPHAGLQVLREEEVLARELLASLSADQLAVAVTSPVAPSDIATRHDPVADAGLVPVGLPGRDLDAAQQERLAALVRCYLRRAPDAVASAAWLAVGGAASLTFAWAGSTTPGEGHYYAVRGGTLLIEYDNTQDGANHVHTVWRDLRGDFGGDLLAAHHRDAHG